MLKRSFFLACLLSTSLLSSVASAGPVADFEAAMRAAYADYRAALFYTNSNDKQKTLAAIDAFQKKWRALSAVNTTPPQYADDTLFAETLSKVAAIADASKAAAEAGNLAESHDKLEAIRDEIGALHERNGIIGFSDLMNAYHAQMEKILQTDYSGMNADGLNALRESAAVLAYLAAEMTDGAGALMDDPAFKSLLADVNASVAALQDAARKGDGAAAKAALGGLKKPYSKMFLKFG